MRVVETAVFCFTAFFACITGKICGMGGGVVIKPVLDAIGVMGVSEINFLSGCTVFGMSAWSVGKTFIKREKEIEIKSSLPLGIGAAAGGLAGKFLFNLVAAFFTDSDKAGGIQAVLLLLLTIATFIYTVNKNKIRSYKVTKWYISIAIGMILGTLGSFLGIGGGPFNMAVLYLFFSMNTKIAAQNSLFIILISQAVSLINTVLSGKTPDVPCIVLAGMVLCGILGSEIGGRVNKRISERSNTILFEAAMILVMLITVYNFRLFF